MATISSSLQDTDTSSNISQTVLYCDTLIQKPCSVNKYSFNEATLLRKQKEHGEESDCFPEPFWKEKHEN